MVLSHLDGSILVSSSCVRRCMCVWVCGWRRRRTVETADATRTRTSSDPHRGMGPSVDYLPRNSVRKDSVSGKIAQEEERERERTKDRKTETERDTRRSIQWIRVRRTKMLNPKY